MIINLILASDGDPSPTEKNKKSNQSDGYNNENLS